MIKLSILIPYTPDREKVLYELLSELHNQIDTLNLQEEVKILTELDNYEMSIGAKRQKLLERARSEYISYVDSDDAVSHDYISSIMEALKSTPDVIGFNGFMLTNGVNRENFKISKDLPYITVSDAFGKNSYLRHSNHLSVVRRSIALKVGYKDLRFAEDYDYSVRLKSSGLLKTEVVIEKDLYIYKYNPKK